ncbi:thiamine diphosphokinase [Spiroplasma floricola]|uniref:Thiamine diphosphokinase n=1 Tax=Spiroplasma floricola 23-6 TaxID=1336749 RepID=A0A2K8SEQ2_9MOLU|nr:thiamine diphosphokinase [Spiroplasma floricola]AUB31947.1 thiamine pyrophosphokinase [Spiroplasma floricola 23-6]
MKDKKALLVISKTNINLKLFEKTHLIVGIERGCLDLIEKQVSIDISMSDFDQVTDSELKLIKEKSKEFISFNSKKDFLDGIAAIYHLKSMNYKDITMVVNPSKRYDMNLTIIEYVFKHNLKVINDNSVIFKLNSGENSLDFNNYQDYTYVSLFSLKENIITIEGMKYEVKEANLEAFNSFAYSNEFISYVNPKIVCKEELMIIMTK